MNDKIKAWLAQPKEIQQAQFVAAIYRCGCDPYEMEERAKTEVYNPKEWEE